MDWKTDNNQLLKRFEFRDFGQALEFTNKVGELAEKAKHHPDIKLGWGYVELSLTTHSESAITDKDMRLAKGVDKLFSEISP